MLATLLHQDNLILTICWQYKEFFRLRLVSAIRHAQNYLHQFKAFPASDFVYRAKALILHSVSAFAITWVGQTANLFSLSQQKIFCGTQIKLNIKFTITLNLIEPYSSIFVTFICIT